MSVAAKSVGLLPSSGNRIFFALGHFCGNTYNAASFPLWCGSPMKLVVTMYLPNPVQVLFQYINAWHSGLTFFRTFRFVGSVRLPMCISLQSAMGFVWRTHDPVFFRHKNSCCSV